MILAKYSSIHSRVILVGGNSGIGLSLTDLLCSYGVEVISLDIQGESCSDRYQDISYCQVVTTDEQAMMELSQKLGLQYSFITGLVCLSGTILNFETIENLEYDAWTKEYDISFKSCYNACRSYSSLLRNADHGAIVNMSSGLAFGGQARYGAYANAKASIISLSKILASELAPNIRVNCVAPGAVDTPFIYNPNGVMRFDEQLYKQISPLGVLAQPEEIAAVILFLLSESASHITGQCIHVNGGTFMA